MKEFKSDYIDAYNVLTTVSLLHVNSDGDLCSIFVGSKIKDLKWVV